MPVTSTKVEKPSKQRLRQLSQRNAGGYLWKCQPCVCWEDQWRSSCVRFQHQLLRWFPFFEGKRCQISGAWEHLCIPPKEGQQLVGNASMHCIIFNRKSWTHLATWAEFVVFLWAGAWTYIGIILRVFPVAVHGVAVLHILIIWTFFLQQSIHVHLSNYFILVLLSWFIYRFPRFHVLTRASLCSFTCSWFTAKSQYHREMFSGAV